jgi:type II secretory pathway pseudopilin PulG
MAPGAQPPRLVVSKLECADAYLWMRGFTYFTVLILVAIMGTGLAAIGTMWHQAAKREKEQQLLFVGGEFRRAIGSYFERSPGAPQYPRSLDDLLVDKRLPVVGRHLRKVYFDPMTGTQDWGLVKEPGGGILGVYSKGTDRPLKTARFRDEDKGFATALTYADWKFVYGTGSLLGPPPGVQGAPSVLAPATGDQAAPIPIAPPSDPSAAKDDPGREARRPGCEKQRETETAACEATGPPSMQNPAAVGCTAGVAERFNTCMDGGMPAAAPAAPAG